MHGALCWGRSFLRHAVDGHGRCTVCVSMQWMDSVIFIEVQGFVLRSQWTVLKVEFDSVWLADTLKNRVQRQFEIEMRVSVYTPFLALSGCPTISMHSCFVCSLSY